jgi:pimeloyl-ACP methyl ester carboxylesterase
LGQVKRVMAVLTTVLSFGACENSDPPTRVAHDALLRAEPVFLYAPADSTRAPRAVVFFFGNDIGFWQPHRKLAAMLAASQFAVAGFDMRPLLRSLPDGITQRDSAFAARIEPIIARARHELGGDTVPLIIAGHSLGAEVAIWTAAHVCPPATAGVLALSPGSRSHLRVAMSDIMNGPEPTGPESFSVPAAVAGIPPDERIAIIRGMRDDYVKADPALLAAGGDRIERYEIPFSGHSLKQLTMAGFQVRRALDWILGDMKARR